MQHPDFWTQSGQAMELIIEGNRIIAQAIARSARELWHRLGNAIAGLWAAESRHLPPV
jgi:hypothetical protein